MPRGSEAKAALPLVLRVKGLEIAQGFYMSGRNWLDGC